MRPLARLAILSLAALAIPLAAGDADRPVRHAGGDGGGPDAQSNRHHQAAAGALRRYRLLMLDRFDHDGDRRLDDAERAEAQAWFADQRGKRRAGADGQPGAAQPAAEETAAAEEMAAGLPQEMRDGEARRRAGRALAWRTHVLMLAKFDADQDGRLDDGERQAARAWFAEQRDERRDGRKDGRQSRHEGAGAAQDDDAGFAFRTLDQPQRP